MEQKLWIVFTVGLFLQATIAASIPEDEEKSRDPDIDLSVPELIVKYGYPAETHTVRTEDGYALGVHRIPYGRAEKGYVRGDRPAVFVQHGLSVSSACWILSGVENSLAYILADAGYDVWLGNARGNYYSRIRTPEQNPDRNEYWKFSWHEGGVYDLPAVIDYILLQTGQEKIFYVGHSMGTTMFYVMAAERPEYNDKIQAMVSLAPVAYMSNVKSIFVRLLSPVASQIGWLLNLIGVYEFLPHSDILKEIGQAFCNEEAKFKELCENVAFLIMGADSQSLNVKKSQLQGRAAYPLEQGLASSMFCVWTPSPCTVSKLGGQLVKQSGQHTVVTYSIQHSDVITPGGQSECILVPARTQFHCPCPCADPCTEEKPTGLQFSKH